MSASVNTVRVELGTRGYDILIGEGLLARAGGLIRPLMKAGRSRVYIVADANVAELHGATLMGALEAVGYSGHLIGVPPGEESKSFAYLATVLDELIGLGAERDDLIIAFGGGVAGDLTGLAAGLLKRGARFVQIPTTLLAQVDSSVGGKTAINSRAGKNMVGLFHQPVLVLADLGVLDTLPARERSAGAKAARGTGALAEAVRVSCASKARIVAIDETEQAERALLNLGHTFGHALERANDFQPSLLHGEGVGIGMAMALRYSVQLGACPGQDAVRAERLLNALGLATRIADLAGGPYVADELLAHMAHDKKARNGRLTLILARGIGQAYIQRDADTGPLLEFLRSETAS